MSFILSENRNLSQQWSLEPGTQQQLLVSGPRGSPATIISMDTGDITPSTRIKKE